MRLISTKKKKSQQFITPYGPRSSILKKVVFFNWVTHWPSLPLQQCWLDY